MTAPGFVPRPDTNIVDRILAIEKRIRNLQQNVAGPTVANGGAPLSGATPQPIGTPTGGTSVSSSRSDHVHASTLAAQQDVAVSSPAAGQVLGYTGTGWANQQGVGCT